MSSGKGHVKVCRCLVASKADVNAKNIKYDSHPYTRLRICRRYLGFVLSVLILVFFSGWTPLHWSSYEGRIEVCQFLFESKADVNAKNVEYDIHPYTRISKCGRAFGCVLNV